MGFSSIPMDDRQVTQLEDLQIKNLIKRVEFLMKFIPTEENPAVINLVPPYNDVAGSVWDFQNGIGYQQSATGTVHPAFFVPLVINPSTGIVLSSPFEQRGVTLNISAIIIPISDHDDTGPDRIDEVTLYDLRPNSVTARSLGTHGSEITGGGAGTVRLTFPNGVDLKDSAMLWFDFTCNIASSVSDLNFYNPYIEYYYKEV